MVNGELLELLFFGANMCAATGYADLDNEGAAAWTSLAIAPEDSGKAQVTAFFTLSIDIISVCTAAFSYGHG